MKKLCPFKAYTLPINKTIARHRAIIQFGYCEEDRCMMYKFCSANAIEDVEKKNEKRQFVPWEAD